MYKYLLGLLLVSSSVSAKQIHLVIIDTGMPKFQTNAKICKNGTYDLTGTDMYDTQGHGTNIMGIISDRLKDIDYCMYVVKIYSDTFNEHRFMNYIKSLILVYYLPDVDIVNLSSNGPSYIPVENVLIEGLIEKKINFVSAAGNQHEDLDKECNSYPACYKGVISVGNGKSNGYRVNSSNYGQQIKQWRDGVHICANGTCYTGTSQSTAIYSADLAKQLFYESIHENKTH